MIAAKEELESFDEGEASFASDYMPSGAWEQPSGHYV